MNEILRGELIAWPILNSSTLLFNSIAEKDGGFDAVRQAGEEDLSD